MTTVTEPPYLHKSQGIAPRNGTLTHVIDFTADGDAPFTPATGSLLVLVIFGAVTHTNAGGWTEQLQPVSSGELSAFTITSAPTTSVTITHNGSNYPTPWCVYEFPAGSTYDTGTSATTGNDTFPALSGLTGGTGNERVIVAALGRTVTSGSETSFGAAWSAPWVEDADQFVSFGGITDGAGFTVAHQINVVATSITPTFTPTYGGSWSTPDREKIVFAINAAAISGGTPAGAADVGLGLAVAATGARSSAATTTTDVGLAVAATGARASSGAPVTTGLNLAVAVTGARPASGTVALTLSLAVAETGTRPSTGAANVGLGLAVAAASPTAPATGTVALTLNLGVLALGPVAVGHTHPGQRAAYRDSPAPVYGDPAVPVYRDRAEVVAYLEQS